MYHSFFELIEITQHFYSELEFREVLSVNYYQLVLQDYYPHAQIVVVFFTSLSQLLPLALIKEVLFCHCQWGHCQGDLEGPYVYERSSYNHVNVIKL